MQSIVLPLRASESGVGWKHRRLRLGLIRRGRRGERRGGSQSLREDRRAAEGSRFFLLLLSSLFLVGWRSVGGTLPVFTAGCPRGGLRWPFF